MNPFPFEQSVLVLDNCSIHHNEAIYELVNGAGKGYMLYNLSLPNS
jgi:hypothetical protein